MAIAQNNCATFLLSLISRYQASQVQDLDTLGRSL